MIERLCLEIWAELRIPREEVLAAPLPKLVKMAALCVERIIRNGGNPEHYMEYFEELVGGANFARRRKLMSMVKGK